MILFVASYVYTKLFFYKNGLMMAEFLLKQLNLSMKTSETMKKNILPSDYIAKFLKKTGVSPMMYGRFTKIRRLSEKYRLQFGFLLSNFG